MTRAECQIFANAIAEVTREVADSLHDRGDNVDYALREFADRLARADFFDKIEAGCRRRGLEPPKW